jgi:hypothetical protein
VREEEGTLMASLYFRNELVLLLGQAGFTDVTMQVGYRAMDPPAEETTVVFIARKRG